MIVITARDLEELSTVRTISGSHYNNIDSVDADLNSCPLASDLPCNIFKVQALTIALLLERSKRKLVRRSFCVFMFTQGL